MVAGDKLGALVRMIEVENPESAIIFCNTKDETERVAQALSRQGYDADWLNGDLPQSDREKVMSRDPRGAAPLPRGDGRRGARHRHLAPDARHQPRLPPGRRVLRAPHRPHRPRRAHRDGDLAHHAARRGRPLPAPPDVQDPADREADPDRGRAEDARRGRPRDHAGGGVRDPPRAPGRPRARRGGSSPTSSTT